MFHIQCQCGHSLETTFGKSTRPTACPSCGVLHRTLSAQPIADDGGNGDFDACLIKKSGAAAPGAKDCSLYFLGGDADISIGRLPDNTLVLPGNKVSRKHALLVRVDYGPSRWKLVDNHSSGGVFVNGNKIQEHDLAAGDKIVIGEFKFEYSVADEYAMLPGADNDLSASPPFIPPEPVIETEQEEYEPQTASGISAKTKIIIASVAIGVLLIAAIVIAMNRPQTQRKQIVKGISERESLLPDKKPDPEEEIVALPPTTQIAIETLSPEEQHSLQSAFNLKRIGASIFQFKSERGSYPATLGDLASLDGAEFSTFIKPGEVGPTDLALSNPKLFAQWVNNNPCYAFTGVSQPGGVAAYEKPGTFLPDLANVLMSDGKVEKMEKGKLEELLRQPGVDVKIALTTQPAPKTQPAGRQMTLAEFDSLPRFMAPILPPLTLKAARKDFNTRIVFPVGNNAPVPKPPEKVFSIVQYESKNGKLPAYLTPDPRDNIKRPAILWIHGYEFNALVDIWTPQIAENDQSGSVFRKSGIVMMSPSMRGGNGNPNSEEGLYGEVDDVIAAARFLASQPHVDPNRIYLAGHRDGANLAMLVAEYSDRFRAVFALGPVANISHANPPSGSRWPFDLENKREHVLRSPGFWLSSIQTPTHIFDGTEGVATAPQQFITPIRNPNINLYSIKDKDIFMLTAPLNALIASKILKDTDVNVNIAFENNEIPGLRQIVDPDRSKKSIYDYSTFIQIAKMSKEPDFSLNIEKLAWDKGYGLSEYTPENLVNYKDKNIELRGIIHSVNFDDARAVSVTGHPDPLRPFWIQCNLAASNTCLNLLSPGQEIILRGTGGYLEKASPNADFLDKCTVLALGPDPASEPVSFDKIYAEFAANPAAASKKYENACLQVKGVLNPGSAKQSFTIKDPRGKSIEVFMPSNEAAEKSTHKPGETVALKGIFSAYNNNQIQLMSCWFLNDK